MSKPANKNNTSSLPEGIQSGENRCFYLLYLSLINLLFSVIPWEMQHEYWPQKYYGPSVNVKPGNNKWSEKHNHASNVLPLPIRWHWSLLTSPQPNTSQHCKSTDICYCITRCACLLPQYLLGTHSPTHRGMTRAELTWVPGCEPKWFTRLMTVTHPCPNRARRRVNTVRWSRPTRYQ